MKRQNDLETSSSEDEACLEALREAADHNFLKKSFFSNEEKKIDIKFVPAIETQAIIKHDDDVEEDYSHHGLTQTCRDFIARKLNERLEKDIILKHDPASECLNKTDSKHETGIKLFTSSKDILTEFEIPTEPPSVRKRQSLTSSSFNEKSNLLRCQEVAIDPDTILSQHEVKHWTIRKPGKIFKYKKLKNGKLSEVQ
ncbi:hypothetical protein QAD02_009153 [Eretmocerus hayati]|uniref:Uncharacterized protein n=1 Tax=Eretmocerus hayati TaxID=131215 RepID=A0ACC2N8H9_9HYME|nr:hypothetical protein QAD02_009153 [Eretmocerus hayati]